MVAVKLLYAEQTQEIRFVWMQLVFVIEAIIFDECKSDCCGTAGGMHGTQLHLIWGRKCCRHGQRLVLLSSIDQTNKPRFSRGVGN